MKGSFYIDGTIHMCPPHPNTEYAEKHLFYIQSFSLMEVGAQYYTKRNGLNSYLLLYTYDGYGQLEYDGQIYELQEGDIFFIDCAKEHCYRSLGPIWKHGDLHINGAFIDGIFQELKNSGQLIFHRSLQDDFFKKMEELIVLYVMIVV